MRAEGQSDGVEAVVPAESGAGRLSTAAGQGKARHTVIEAVILGRNDDYEPQWADKLYAAIAYNRQVLTGHGYEFRVAFVEWNPPRDRPLLSTELVERFPYVRCVVVAPDVHDEVCRGPMPILLNHAINAAIRSSRSDFLVVTGGDCFFGQALGYRILASGLVENCLYRAERVNIRSDLEFTGATREQIEDPGSIVSVDTCSEPPYDRPPFTNASGDFLMMDRVTMTGLRGFDEAIDFSKLHLDSRMCWTAMEAQLECELLGRIFHISHRHSYVNAGSAYDSQGYEMRHGLPYLNPDNWGLADFDWQARGDRLWFVGQRSSQPGAAPQPLLSDRQASGIDRLRSLIRGIRAARYDQKPVSGACEIAPVPLEGLWLSERARGLGDGKVELVQESLGMQAQLQIPEDFPVGTPKEQRWVALTVEALEGDVLVRVRGDGSGEGPAQLVRGGGGDLEVWLKLPDGERVIDFSRFRSGGPTPCFVVKKATIFGSLRPSRRGRIHRGIAGRTIYRLQRFMGPA